MINKLEVSVFNEGDTNGLDQADYWSEADNVPISVAENYAKLGPAWVVRSGAKVVMIVGVVQLFAGNATLWALCLNDLRPYTLPLARELKALLEAYDVKVKPRIFSYWVADDRAGADRLALFLGFTNQARLPKYGPRGQDIFVFTRNGSAYHENP